MKGSVALVPLVAGMLSLASAASAAPKVACPEAVLHDWSDGRIEGVYSVDCYRAALDTLPEDLLVYSSAADDINRALRARITAARHNANKNQRQLSSRSAGRPAEERSAAPSDNGVAAPIPLIALATVTLLFLAAGTTALLARNLRARHSGPLSTRRRS